MMPKHVRRLAGIDEQVISLNAKGMTTRCACRAIALPRVRFHRPRTPRRSEGYGGLQKPAPTILTGH